MHETKFSERYIKLLDGLPIDESDKNIIQERYVALVSSAEVDYRRVNVFYIILTNTITIAGILITAFVSFDKLSLINSTTTQAFLWVVWTLGILLTLANKWLYVFNIPKQYLLNTVILEKLYSEGWSFLSEIGRYKNIDDPSIRFKLFCTRIEKIKMKSLEVAPEMDSVAITGILATGSAKRNIKTQPTEPVVILPVIDNSSSEAI